MLTSVQPCETEPDIRPDPGSLIDGRETIQRGCFIGDDYPLSYGLLDSHPPHQIYIGVVHRKHAITLVIEADQNCVHGVFFSIEGHHIGFQGDLTLGFAEHATIGRGAINVIAIAGRIGKLKGIGSFAAQYAYSDLLINQLRDCTSP